MSARADPITQVLRVLNNADAYISDLVYQAHEARAGDINRLNAAANSAYNQNVPEKIALLQRFPSNIHTAAAAAANIRNFEDFSGVVIVVWPHGIGIDSDMMTSSEEAAIVATVGPSCRTSFTDCAVAAARRAIPIVHSEQSSAYRNAAIFWGVTLLVIALLIVGVVIFFRRRTERTIARLGGSGDSAAPFPEIPGAVAGDAGGTPALPEPHQNSPGAGG